MGRIAKFIVALAGMAVEAIIAMPSPNIEAPEWVYPVIAGVTAILVWAFPNSGSSGA